MGVVLGQVLGFVGPRLNPLFLLVLFFCLSTYVAIWVFCLFAELLPSVVLTVMATFVLVSHFVSPPAHWKDRGEWLWGIGLIMCVLCVLIGEWGDWGFLTGGGALIFIALPFWWTCWRLTGRQWFLSSGHILAAVMAMAYWAISPVRHSDDNLGYLLLPLPLVAGVGLIWVIPATYVLYLARRWKFRRIRGPLMQVIALVIWFMPSGAVAAFGPVLLELNSIWSAASLTVVGVVLGTVVSAPLRFLLLEWSELSVHPPTRVRNSD